MDYVWTTSDSILAADGERYEFLTCTVALFFSRSLVVAQYIVFEDSTCCSLNEIFHSIYVI
jgi:hypothetical protein